MKALTTLLFAFLFSSAAIGQNTITVVSPNGGETWIKGCPSQIQWATTAASTSPVRIDLYKGNLFFMNIAPQVPPGTTTFTWIPVATLQAGTDYRVKVSSLSNLATYDFSDGNFSILQGTVTVVSPNGGENWVKGTVHPITWTTNLCGSMRIELWKGSAYLMLITAAAPATGPFSWAIPATLATGSDYRIKLLSVSNAGSTTTSAYDFSDGMFTLSDPSPGGGLTVVNPNGGETWIMGCPAVITWISSAASMPVKVELYRNNAWYRTIAAQVSGSSITWMVPLSIAAGPNFRVKITSLANPAVFDLSDNDFTISAGAITVLSPNGGETWLKGSIHPVTWSDNICGNVRIELWKGGAFHSLIAASVPSNGFFNWMIPNTATLVPGGDYKVKVMGLIASNATTNVPFDFSDNFFAIAAAGPVTGTGNAFRPYPNPFEEVLHVRVTESIEGPLTLQVVTLEGTVAAEFSCRNAESGHDIELNTSKLSPGAYLFLVKQEGKIIGQHRVFRKQ